MKKLTALFLIALMILTAAMTGCAGGNTETSESSASQEETSSAPSQETSSEEESTEEIPSSPEESSSSEEGSSGEEQTGESTETDETSSSESEESTETPPASEDENREAKEASLSRNYPNVFVVVGTESLNVRETPNGALIGGISKNGGGEVLDEDTEGWLHIVSGTLEGYVSKEFTATGEEGYALAMEQMKERVRVKNDIINVRSAPDLDAEVLGAARNGAIFDIRGEEEDFYKIRYSGNQEGYVHKSVVEKDWFLTGAVRVERQEVESTSADESGSEDASDSETEPEDKPGPDSESGSESVPAASSAEPTQAPTAAPANTSGIPQRVTQGSNGLIVCIDAGHQQHGMSDQEPIGPGASQTKAKLTTGTAGCVTGIAEYVVNLQVALKLEQVLLNRGYTVVMIRVNNDCPYSNRERALVANDSGANCFIRIHCNSLDNSSVTGALSYAPTAANPYVPQDVIGQSQRFAQLVNERLCAATGAQNRGIIDGDQMTGINWCKVPVALVEMGFMSNPDEDRKLCDDGYQNLLAEGMANGIDAFFGR